MNIWYGIIWGLFELFPGTLLHIIKDSIAGAVLFPVGILCMWGAYKKSGVWWHIPATALIAAVIKIPSFALSSRIDFIQTLYPFTAIIIEGLISILPIIYLTNEQNKKHKGSIVKPIIGFFAAISLYKIIFYLFKSTIRWGGLKPFVTDVDIPKELIILFTDSMISSAIIGIVLTSSEIWKLLSKER